MKIYQIKTRSGAFRRAGRRFTVSPSAIPESALTPAQIEALTNEPHLLVDVVEVDLDENTKTPPVDPSAGTQPPADPNAATKTPANPKPKKPKKT